MNVIRFILIGFVSLGMIICLAGTALADLNDGLLGYYSFSGNADDESVNDNDGTVYGATLVEDRHGNADSAYYFDGNDYIVAPDVTELQVSDALTLSAWIKKSSDASSRIVSVFQAEGSSNMEYSMMSNGGKMRIQTKDDANNIIFNDHFSNTPISTNEWHHLAFTYDGSDFNFYLDGVSDASGSLSTLIRDIDPNPYLYIGASGNVIDEFFTGAIDELRIYDRALSISEIQTISEVQTIAAVAPEPISTVLFLAGGATMGFVRLRKKR